MGSFAGSMLERRRVRLQGARGTADVARGLCMQHGACRSCSFGIRSQLTRSDNITDIDVGIDVVREDVVRAIMLMVPRTFNTCSNVERKDFISASFVGVISPPAVIVRLHVVADLQKVLCTSTQLLVTS